MNVVNSSAVSRIRFRRNLPCLLGAAAALTLSGSHSFGQPISVPNSSFETPGAPMVYPYVSLNVDSWQKADKPAYFDQVEQNYGILWDQTAAIFFGPGAYGNMAGNQAAYLFSFPQVTLFQDYDSMDYNDAGPTHDFNAKFEVGKSYNLTLGVYGKGFSGNMTEGSMLSLSLYYRDGANMVAVGSPTIVTYSAAMFPTGGALNLLDYQVTLPAVQASNAWAGQQIGIKIESLYGTGDGYWDIDNVRLTAVPEPSTLALAGIGVSVLVTARRRRA